MHEAGGAVVRADVAWTYVRVDLLCMCMEMSVNTRVTRMQVQLWSVCYVAVSPLDSYVHVYMCICPVCIDTHGACVV